MPARAQDLAAKVGVDAVPVHEIGDDTAMRGLVRTQEVAQRLVREHHTPTKGLTIPIALHNMHVMLGMLPFDEQRKVESCGSATNDADFHMRSVVP